MSPERESEVSPTRGSAAGWQGGRRGGRRESAASASVPAQGQRVIPSPMRVLAGGAAVCPSLAGTLVSRRSCRPSPPAVGVDPAVSVRPQASRPGRVAFLESAPAWRLRPVGPRATGRAGRTWPTLAWARLPSRGRGGGALLRARGLPSGWRDTLAHLARVSAGHRWAKFLLDPGVSGRGLPWSRALPRETAHRGAYTAPAEGAAVAPRCEDPGLWSGRAASGHAGGGASELS